MTFISNIENKKSSFTKNEMKACERILDNLMRVQRLSLTKMSEEINVSKTTILRFCQKIGYSGYTEFRFECIKYVNSLKNIEEKNDEKNRLITNVSQRYIDTISQFHMWLDDNDMRQIVEFIKSARIIRCIGEINSSVTCYQLRYALAMYGYNVDVLTAASEVVSIDLSTNDSDVILLISANANPESNIIKETMRLAEGCKTPIILITMNSQTSIKQKVDLAITLPSVASGNESSLLENVPIYSVFVQVLLSYLS
ncbi:hypothetical protein AOC36_05630 [Erysipelothrix larvae]|uniref:Transcriptional regulator n=1 Tax=Erysipelothrix larvae TaxID=1514105 RepID=A0A0X8GZU8_9FIRM|nr:MurR/RpiR family transcriptional regulator [Erysipelothrix larvae]AMC93477.1 hypothetical protein AOC36_05630 [Erysipelothrix larvae]